jgi:Mn-dependent DtxR family transcriptional regulator
MVAWDRPEGIDVKDIMILKGIAQGKTYREIQRDTLHKSTNSIRERMELLKRDGYITYEHYSRERRLTEAGRELLRKALS